MEVNFSDKVYGMTRDEHHIPLKKKQQVHGAPGVTAEGPQEFNV